MRHRTENQIELILIRHGATAGNRERRYVGRTDESLCAEGKDILLANKKNGWYPPADRIFISPMRRCQETARILYPDQEPVRIPEWTEIDFGDFEGKNYEDLKGDARYQAWIDSGGALPFPGGESREEFARRCGAGLERMAEFIFSQEEKLPERTAAKRPHILRAALIAAALCLALVGTAFAAGAIFSGSGTAKFPSASNTSP